MSCFVMNREPVAALADFLAALGDMGHDFFGFEMPRELRDPLLDCRDKYGYLQADRIYAELYRLNLAAYRGRYDREPVDPFVPKYRENIQHSRAAWIGGRWEVLPWVPVMVKRLECFAYQCSESATAGDPLLAGVEALINVMALFIVHNSDDWSRAAWGC